MYIMKKGVVLLLFTVLTFTLSISAQSQFGVRSTLLIDYTYQQAKYIEDTYFGNMLGAFQFDFIRKTTFANAAKRPGYAAYYGLRTLFDFETITLDLVDCGNSDYPILVGKQEVRFGLVGGVEQYVHFKNSSQKRFQFVLGAEGQATYAVLDNRFYENPISKEESSAGLPSSLRFQLGAEISLGLRYQFSKLDAQKHIMLSLPFQLFYTPNAVNEQYESPSCFVIPSLRLAFFW